ncbi:bifunctional nuclease family protein [Microbacterium elymi]|jgi:bifunctional DNase/RNase|uniref:Bifunctional nuclease family protein n=1 Tax=Microbacterium elymi TaxID=2909587 RepID=A0ABY5NMT4_9MICO|nr:MULTISPECIES: bifunctional nuclease family protein [Microbacterium]UUT36480.1 bifunctional nuclease family protein [Microbacterium elymi]
MVQVRVAGVALDTSGQHVILLQPLEAVPAESKLLPIWIGEMEATAIMVAIEGTETPRPLTHDLLRTVLETLGATVERVEITRIDDGTFYAEITVAGGTGGVQRIDARPSDAVALAARTDAPIFVADEVLAAAGVDDVITEAETETEVEEFSKFIEEVDPEDFRE